MKTHSEVNFEKRGKLEDHQECPVCGCCVCPKGCGGKHIPGKILFLLFLLSTFLFLVSLPVQAQTINYKIKVLDNPIVDLNNHGAVITDDALILKSGKSQSLVCPGSDVQGLDNTIPNKLNDFQVVAGYCFQPGVGDVGFIRNRNGSYDFIHPLGSSATFINALNDLGMVAGQFFENGRYRGFIWDKVQYIPVDFPAPNSQTAILALNNDMVAAGCYFTFDAVTNEASEWECFLRLPNGAFLPFDRAGADWAFPKDMNNSGLVLGMSDPGGIQGGPSEPSGPAFVNDDGVFKSLGLPATVLGFDATFSPEGLNNDGEVAGGLQLLFCANPADPITCSFFQRGFIATPKKN